MIYEFGEFQIDTLLFELRRTGQVLSIQRTVLAALVYLIEHRERIVTKDELIAGPWHGVSVSDGSISQAIMIARKVLEDDGANQRFIRTVRGVGYRFAADVRVQPGAAQAPAQPLAPPPAPVSVRAPSPCGRDAELAELLACLQAAQAGQGSVVLLAGPPGIGKTYLCEHVTHESLDRGLPVAWGRSWEGGGAPAFWPWSQIFRRLLVDPELDAAAEVSPREVGHLIQLLPDIADCFPESQRERVQSAAGAQPHQLFETTANVLHRIAKRHGALGLVLEDLHASDVSSVALLDYLAKGLRQSNVWAVGTYRDVELRSVEPIATLLGGLHGVRCTLTLDGLKESEVASMLGARPGREPSEDLVRRIHRATAGNPLFLQEVRRLLDAEQLVGADIGKVLSRIPGRIAEAIRRHLRKLPDLTRQLVDLAAVIGPDFDLPLLQFTAGQPAQQILEALTPAIDAGLLQDSYEALAHYRFSHELIRNTVYGELSPAARASMHQHVGEAIESLHPAWNAPYSRLAHHYFAAAAVGTAEKAVTYAIKAGDKAMASTAHVEAIEHFQLALQALELMKNAPRQHGDVLLRLGTAYRLSGRTDDAVRTFARAVELARDAKLPRLFAKAALGHGFTWRAWARDETLIGLLQEALDQLDNRDSALRTVVTARLAASLWFSGPSERERRVRLSADAIAMGRRLGDPVSLSAALICAHTATWGSVPVIEQLAISEEIIAVAESSANSPGLRESVQEGRLWRIADLCELGRFAEADREIARYAKEAEIVRHPLELSWVARWKGMRAAMAGDLPAALSLATQARELGRRAGDLNASPFYWEQRQILDAAADTRQSAVPRTTRMVEHHPDLVLAQLRLARALCDDGSESAAQRILDRLQVTGFERMPDNHTRFSALVAGAAACAHLGPQRARQAARQLYEILLPDAERILTFGTAAVCYGPAHHCLGLLAFAAGDTEAALAHFAAARARAQCLNAPLWEIEAQLAEAELRIATPGHGEAVEALLRSALAASQQLELGGLERRARALLADRRSGPHPAVEQN